MTYGPYSEHPLITRITLHPLNYCHIGQCMGRFSGKLNSCYYRRLHYSLLLIILHCVYFMIVCLCIIWQPLA